MLSPTTLYPLVLLWVQALRCCPHRTGQQALASLVTALLTAQSLQRTALMRALVSPRAVPARQRYRRVARLWDSQWLSPAWLTPALVRAAVALVVAAGGGGTVRLALDSVRCGQWEVFTLGVVWHGRVLVVGWAVLPYPWPKGQFTPTVGALLEQVGAVWPPGGAVHLVADRAFGSYAFFRTLERLGWTWTVRLQARHWVTVGGVRQQTRALVGQVSEGHWRAWAGTYGQGKGAVAGTVVIGRGLHVLPAHQANPGSLRHRAARAARRVQHAASKHGAAASAYESWVLLFTTAPTPVAARNAYRQRWPIEGTYRDAQSGWDGQHGWGLDRGVPALATPEAVSRLVGLWALGVLVQSWVGDQVGRPTAPPLVQQTAAQWTTTGRLSVWARGRLALTDSSGALGAWLEETLRAGAARVAAAPTGGHRLTLWPVASLRPIPAKREAA
jgi:Transposase DDE domain